MLQEEYFQTHQFHETLALYEQTRDGQRHGFLDASDLTDIAEYYYNAQRHNEAFEVLEHALYMYPNATLPLTYKARIVLWEENNPGKARQLMTMCDDTDMPEYHLTMGEILLVEEKDEQAHKSFLQYVDAVEHEERASAALDVLAVLIDYHVLDDAGFWLKEAEALSNTDEYLKMKAEVCFINGQFDKAENILEQMVDHDPFNAFCWYQLALCRYNLGNVSQAIEDVNYALAVEPDNDEMLSHKALCLFTVENYKDALPLLQRLVNRHPDDTQLLFPLGICLYNLGFDDETIDVMVSAAAHNPVDSPLAYDIYSILAELTEKKGEKALAETYRSLMQQASHWPDNSSTC